ncbi:MAG TPA: hypothetical protein VHY59_01570, partial [Chthoniobacterales bacterium]|nr:hypothetical protein [Chthoniobacterales bacterium]
MKPVLFKILVLSAGVFLLLIEPGSVAARGGGGGGGGRVGGMGGGRAASRTSVSGGGLGGGGSRMASRPNSRSAGGLGSNKKVAEGNIHRSRAASRVQSDPKAFGSALRSIAQGIKPGTSTGGNKSFRDIADKTGNGQLAGKAVRGVGGELGHRLEGADVGALRNNLSPERDQAMANRQQYWDKWVTDHQGKVTTFRSERNQEWGNINNFRKSQNVAASFNDAQWNNY